MRAHQNGRKYRRYDVDVPVRFAVNEALVRTEIVMHACTPASPATSAGVACAWSRSTTLRLAVSSHSSSAWMGQSWWCSGAWFGPKKISTVTRWGSSWSRLSSTCLYSSGYCRPASRTCTNSHSSFISAPAPEVVLYVWFSTTTVTGMDESQLESIAGQRRTQGAK